MVESKFSTTFLIFLHSDSVIDVHAGEYARPLNSSSYTSDQIDLSSGANDIILMSVGDDRF